MTQAKQKEHSSIRDEIDAANEEAVDRINKGKAMLVDFAPAKKVIPGM